MTQNIFGAAPGWRARCARLAELVEELALDVIGLQEVHAADVSGRASQAHELAARLGDFHVDFAPARVAPTGECEGVALLCRHGIKERSVEALTLDVEDFLDRAGQRVVLCGMLEVEGAAIDVMVTHLSLSKRARVRTVKELAAFAEKERARSGSRAAVLMGDFNAQPGEPAIAALEQARWLDAWRAAHGTRASARLRGATWPAFLPMRRIDYVFVQGPWSLGGCARVATWASDHCAVVARLAL